MQTALQVLARDHNWRMGRLLRDRANIQCWRCPSARIAGINAIDLEIKISQQVYEDDRAALRAKVALLPRRAKGKTHP